MIEQFIGVQTVYAHDGEEGESEEITALDYAGPGLAILIIVLAVFLSRQIRKQKNV